MAKNCVTEKTALRQEWIENGLVELMGQQCFEQITVTELCRHLNLSRRSFYRYFRDLEDVLESALDHTFQSMAIPGIQPQKEELQRNFEFWQSHKSLLDALHRSGMTDRIYDYIGRYTEELSPEDFLLPEDLQIRREISLFASAGSIALILGWYRDGFRQTPEEMACIARRMLYHPLLKQQ